jgi:hypothetical protein
LPIITSNFISDKRVNEIYQTIPKLPALIRPFAKLAAHAVLRAAQVVHAAPERIVQEDQGLL